MKNEINKIAYIAVFIIICVLLSACSSQTSNNKINGKSSDADKSNTDGIKSETTADYTIACDNNKFFIIFDNIDIYQTENQDICTVDFDTVEEFYDSVTKGLLTDTQKRIIATSFRKSDDGSVLTCDFNNLFVPKIPNEGKADGVSWEGETYSFSLTFDSGIFGWLTCFTENNYNNRYRDDYLNYFDKEKITVIKEEKYENGKTATYYATNAGQFMNIRYVLPFDDKTITVDKFFVLETNNSELSASSTVPLRIKLYCESGEWHCCFHLYNFSVDPDDEWLKCFGAQRYMQE